jgi:diguanylate cyclase (GGDEF)-like protein
MKVNIFNLFGVRTHCFRSGRAVVLLSILVVAAIASTAGFMIWHSRQATLDEHRHSMSSMGIVLAEQTSRYAQVIDLMLREVHAQVIGRNITTPEAFRQELATPDFKLYLAERIRNVAQADTIAVIAADGMLVNWSRPEPVARLDTKDRDYYSYFKQSNDPGLFIGTLSKARATGRLSLFFARRINRPDGGFLGLVLGIVDVQYLNDFYKAAVEHLNEAVTLVRRDGTMLMRYPDPEAALNVKIPPSSPWHSRVAAGGGNYFTPGILAGVQGLVSVHPLRDYPLVVDIVMDGESVFVQWRKDVTYIASFGFAAAVAFAGLFWLLARQFRRQSEQNDQLAEATIQLSEGQQMLRAYAEMSADWFWELDAEFRFRQKTVIPFLADADDTGMTRWELAGTAMSEERWAPHKAMLAARLPFRDFQWERVGPDGKRHFILVSGAPAFDRTGAFSGYRGTGREVTAEVESKARLARANAELEQGRQRFDAVLSNINQGICFFDGTERLLLCNRRYNEIYNLPPEMDYVGASLTEIMRYRGTAGTGLVLPSEYFDVLAQVRVQGRAMRAVTALRNGRSIEIYHQPMPEGGWVATHEDITERQQSEASLLFMARHDALTKLPNRVLFQERMEQAIALAGRGTRFALLCLDLDNFKQVNDTLGHPAGDGLLVAAAERLQACVREGDTLARLGGDEFAIIQLGINQGDDAEILANRIITAFRQPFDISGHQVMAGVSIGVTLATDDRSSYATLMRDADIALYLAKTEGRGTARFFEPEMDARIHLRRMLELDLQGAVARNEFELYYQPQINLASNKISGFEALLRWNHPVRGFVSPLDFIPVAEETGLIVEIGEWVLRAACFEAENWSADISVAVNLSPIQFKKGDLALTVQAALAASGLRADRLELEITESVFLRDTADTLAALHKLRAMGISVALDDFGTGYSSLSYLRSFPFNKIKIDQSFVRDLMTNKESVSIVRAVTGLGKSLGIMTIAEGVETREQLNRLREEGCREVQGYFFSPPRPASEVPALIRRFQHIDEAESSTEVRSLA